jgi:hypothetical protein
MWRVLVQRQFKQFGQASRAVALTRKKGMAQMKPKIDAPNVAIITQAAVKRGHDLARRVLDVVATATT